ncbi:hypothetical protein CsatB_006912 [Cannabis sativa]
MAKIKNAQSSKRPSRGSTSASPISPPVPPALMIGVPGSSFAPTKTTRKLKTQARKSTYNLASPPVIASQIATPTPGFGDHDESHSSNHTFSKSSSSNGAQNVEKAMATLPTVSSRTRSKVSTPQKHEMVLPKNVPKGEKVVPSSSKAKNLKEYPPSVSSSDSEPKEGIEEDHESEGLSDSSEEFVSKEQPYGDDYGSGSEEPEADLVSTKPVAVPTAIPKKDKGKRPIVSPSPILPHKRKRPSSITLENFKPHSHYFCYNGHARDMKFYENRNFTVEKNFNVIAYKPFGVYNMLKERQ